MNILCGYNVNIDSVYRISGAEISELLAISSRGDVEAMYQAAQVRLHDIDNRIAELGRMREALSQLMSSCPRKGRDVDCPILNALVQRKTLA